MAFEGVSWVNIQHSLGSGAGDDDAEHGDDRPSELWGRVERDRERERERERERDRVKRVLIQYDG